MSSWVMMLTGAIIVTTRKAQSDFEGQFRASAAEDSTYVGALTLGGTIGDGADSFLVYGNFRTSDGFRENTFLGRDDIVITSRNIYGGAYQLINDWYAKDYYKRSPKNDPPGPKIGTYRTNRGGSWLNSEKHARSYNRSRNKPDLRRAYLGFRLARDL